MPREHAEHRANLRVVQLKQNFVGVHPDCGGQVVALGLSDQRMNHQAVAYFERRFLDVFVRAMSRIAGLERDDLFPSTLAKRRAGLPRLARELEKSAPRYLFDQRYLAGETVGRHRGDVLRSRMRVLGSPEYGVGFL